MANGNKFSWHHIPATLTGIWLGFYLSAGYIAAPILFRHLERLTAGNIAGELFSIANYSGLVLWAGLWIYLISNRSLDFWEKRRRKSPTVAAVIWLLLAANQWLVTPIIVALKTHAAPNWLWSLTGGSFGVWHGISSTIYLITGILATALTIRHISMAR